MTIPLLPARIMYVSFLTTAGMAWCAFSAQTSPIRLGGSNAIRIADPYVADRQDIYPRGRLVGQRLPMTTDQSTAYPSGRRRGSALILVLLLCLGTRLAMNVRTMHNPPYADEVQYDAIAYNIAEGNGFSQGNPPKPTAVRAPITPYFAAAIYRLGGHHPENVRLAEIFIDTLNCALVFLLGLLLSGTLAIAFSAAAIYAVHPLFPYIAGHIYSDQLFTLLFLSALILLLVEEKRHSLWLLGLSAAAMALSMLTRPTSMLFPAVIVGLLYLQGLRTGKPWLGRSVIYLAVILLVLSPWIVRNFIVFKAFVPLTTLGGENLYVGAGPAPGGITVATVNSAGVPREIHNRIKGLSEPDVNRILTGEAIKLIRAHPLHWCNLCVQKFFKLWLRVFRPGWATPLGVIMALGNASILALAWLGLRRLKWPLANQLAIATFVYFSVLHMVMCAELRYSVPAYAYLLPFTAIGMFGLLDHFRPAQEPQPDDERSSGASHQRAKSTV